MSWETLEIADQQSQHGAIISRLSGLSRDGQCQWRIRKIVYVGLQVYVALHETRRHDSGRPDQIVHGVVVYMDPHPAGHRIRIVDEREGPDACDCPLEVLNLLTPTDDPLAIVWRERCARRAS